MGGGGSWSLSCPSLFCPYAICFLFLSSITPFPKPTCFHMFHLLFILLRLFLPLFSSSSFPFLPSPLPTFTPPPHLSLTPPPPLTFPSTPFTPPPSPSVPPALFLPCAQVSMYTYVYVLATDKRFEVECDASTKAFFP